MKHLLFILSLSLLLSGCSNSKRSSSKITEFIPSTSKIVLNIKDLETFKSDLKNNALIEKLIASSALNNVLSNPLEHFNSNTPVLVCFDYSKGVIDYTLITKYTDSLFKNKDTDTLLIYTTQKDSIFIGSSSKSIIDNIRKKDRSWLSELEQLPNTNSSFSVFLNNESTHMLGNSIFATNITKFSNLAMLDTDVTPNQITFNGLVVPNDSLTEMVDIFKNTLPQECTIHHIVSSKSDGFLSFTFDNFNTIYQNLKPFKQQQNDSTLQFDLFETINEVGEIYFKDKTAIVLKSIDASATIDALGDHQNIISSYRNINLLEFNKPSFHKDVFGPLINTDSVSKYINIEDYFVFSNSDDVLHNIISDFQNGVTLNNDVAYNQTAHNLSNEASLLVVAKPNTLKRIFNTIFNDVISTDILEDYKYSGFQLVQDDTFLHLNGIIKKDKTRAVQNTINEMFNVTLDADVLSQAQFVINHRSKQKDIVVQDIDNKLYLISNRGKILWKKQLNGNILGRIKQVDLYKNGRLQLAFSTPKRVYIIDRNGNDVSPFPLRFNDEITQPLSVFDYDNKKDYRFVVAQNNALLMYNKNGKNVSGFKYRKSSSAITTQPKHFKINNKDYIVFAAGTSLKILNRKGQSRITVKESINFSKNEIFKYKNTFTTTTSQGDLIQVNLKGLVSIQSLNLSSSHYIETTNKTLVTLSENKLTIKQKSMALDYGNYTHPKIFYLNDKIYVSLTDLQVKKTYLFDSQLKAINGFPIYGNSAIDLANIDTDDNLELVTKGEHNSIIIYQKN